MVVRAGVVHEDVDRPGHRRDLVGAGIRREITERDVGATTGSADRGGHRLGASFVSTVNHDARALAGEELGDRLAQARGGARHEGTFV